MNPPGGNITPRTGAWTYDEVTPVSSTCPKNLSDGENGTFGIDSSSAATFHIVPNDGTAPFSCGLDRGAFNCPNRAAATEDLRPGIDAVITAHVVATGTFSSDTRGSGRQDATVDCVGTQCAGVASFPCNFKVDFVIHTR